jgi:hypothetical protein
MAAYRTAPFDARGEAWGKTAALEALEAFLPDKRILDFFLAVVADPAEYDMARLHLLKLFEFNPVPTARSRIGECVAAMLPREEDWTVRCWLARAVAAFSDIPAARAAAIARALDPSEDEDVRHNCVAGLWGSDPEAVPALQQLAGEDSLLGRAARERLARPSSAEPNPGADALDER